MGWRRHHGPHFHRAGGCGRAARRPLERVIQPWNVDDEVAAQQLFRVGERPVLHLTLAVTLAQRGGSVGQLQAVPVDGHASLVQRADLGHPGTHIGLRLDGLAGRGLVVGRVIKREHELHGSLRVGAPPNLPLRIRPPAGDEETWERPGVSS